MNPESNYEKITTQLNPAQQRAVKTLDGPLLILAGAGSGKTRVLTQRMALLIAAGKAAPNEVLAVTFTNKAAKEMESRIFSSLSEVGVPIREPLWVSTFHSFCSRILRSHIELLGYKPFFTIYDDSDQLSQIKKVMHVLNISDKTHPAKSFRSRINTAKMHGLDAKDLERSNKIFVDKKTIEVYLHYEAAMKQANALDFGDLLLKTVELFKMYPDVLEQYQNLFKYIMIDEYQDTNHIQYQLIQLLAKKSRNLCVVGDEDQSIYSWRGADIKNILDFEKDFPEAKVIKLEENYRSTNNIVTAATKLIKNNTQRKDKTLFTNNSAGDLIQIREEKNEYEEARFVVKNIQKLLQAQDSQLSDFAIFYRTNAQSRVLEEQLRTNSIPYQIIGGVRFYERMEIKDVLCYLKLAINPQDDIAFKRIVNVPARGIGKTTVERIEELAHKNNLSLLAATKKSIDEKEFNSGTTSKLRSFTNLMEELQQSVETYNLLDFYNIVLEKTKYIEKLKSEESLESSARIDNLEELSNAMAQFMKERDDSSIKTFLEEMALISDIDTMNKQISGVTLMTLHVSKGLEFPNVFVVGLEENLFPSAMANEDNDDESELEEERRLCYVGMTRAREKLFLTYARTRRVWGQEQFNPPSRFLEELPKEHIQFSTALERPSFVDRMKTASAFSPASFKKAPPRMEFDEFPDYDSDQPAGSTQIRNSDYQKGMRIRHPTFGSGSIFEVEGSGDQQKVTVLFADQTIKKFVAKYARLEKV